MKASVALVIEGLARSSLGLEARPASDLCHAASGSLTDLTPLPSPLQLLDLVRYHSLVTFLRVLHIEDNPSIGASDLAVVEADSVFALVTAGWGMPVSDAFAACETEVLLVKSWSLLELQHFEMRSGSHLACGEHAKVDHARFVDTAEGTPSSTWLVNARANAEHVFWETSPGMRCAARAA